MSDTSRHRSEAVPARTDDSHAWSETQARLLREGRFADLDGDEIADVMDSMARATRALYMSHLRLILVYLLELEYGPTDGLPRRALAIERERDAARRLKSDCPSLEQYLPAQFKEAYGLARRDAARALEVAIANLPETPPYSVADGLRSGWYPRKPTDVALAPARALAGNGAGATQPSAAPAPGSGN